MYLELRELENKALECKDPQASLFAFAQVHNFIGQCINNFKYTHSDLTKEEDLQLRKDNGLVIDNMQFYNGRYVVGLVGDVETKTMTLANLYEYDVIKVLYQINEIISKRLGVKNESAYIKKLELQLYKRT